MNIEKTIKRRKNLIQNKDIMILSGISTVFSIVTIFIATELNDLNKNLILLLLFFFLLPLLAVITNKIIQRINPTNNLTFKIIKIIFNIFICILFLINIVIIDLYYDINDECFPIYSNKYNYVDNLYNSTDKKDRILHFPNSIPNGAKKYKFKIYKYNQGYISFFINEEYIKETINRNKDKIYNIKNLNEIDIKKLLNTDLNISQHEKSLYTIFLLKNSNNNEEYTSGIIVSNEKKHIIFFYTEKEKKIFCNSRK